ncbi:MAG: DUF4249 domain-containing protein, partial [Psychroflexus sp.]
PRLVVDATIKWEKDTEGNEQFIYLSKSGGFYDDELVKVSDAEIHIENNNGDIFSFEEIEAGTYKTSTFEPEIGMEYSLKISVEGKTYTASETLIPVPPIDFIFQNDEGGFFGDNIEIEILFQDSAEEENYYLFTFDDPNFAYPEFNIFDDQFTNGNQLSISYSDEDLKPGDTVDIQMLGISESYYNFLNILLDQVGSSGGPFATQPATVRGNIENTADEDELIFGYFSLSEMNEIEFVIQEPEE